MTLELPRASRLAVLLPQIAARRLSKEQDDRVSAVPALQQLARLITGEPEEALRQLLVLVCEQLGMDVAFVGVLDDESNRMVRQSVHADGTPGPVGLIEPLGATWCGRVVADGALLVDDARNDPSLMVLPSTVALSIASYAGVPLLSQDGDVFGTLCALGHTPNGTLNPRDLAMLTGLAEVVAPLVLRPDEPSRQTPVDMDAGLESLAALAAEIEGAHDVERLSRHLLDALHDLTGMASTYLTAVHVDAGAQEIRFARNTRAGFEIPEGLFVEWEDTLCKRALDEDSAATSDVPGVWGDSIAAQDLGIQVYVSVPVTMSDGKLWGTLCAADSVTADDARAYLPTMRLFARLIAAEVEREATVQQARAEAATDPLTGCSSRRVVRPWLTAQLAALVSEEVIVVAFADLDHFKSINDTFGHAAGDSVLAEAGHRLRAAGRPDDLVARLGGDEFLIAARVPRGAALAVIERVQHALEFSSSRQGAPVHVRASVGSAVSDGHSADSLIAAADAAMYAVKGERNRGAGARASMPGFHHFTP